MTQTTRRRWTVRPGVDGQGVDAFEVYAATMEEARASVLRTAEESRDVGLRGLVRQGFTVHAMTPGAEVAWLQALSRNAWVSTVPAPDLPREPAAA